MEDMTIVRFFVDKEKRGKVKRHGPWQYYVQREKMQAGKDYLYLLNVQLPGLIFKKKGFSEKSLTEYLQGIPIPPEGRCTYYLYDEAAEEFLGRKNEPLSSEWVLWLIQNLKIEFDALILFWDREAACEILLERYVRNTRYIGVVTGDEDYVSQWSEILWEEYGCLLDTVAEAGGLHIPDAGKKLIVGGDELFGLSPGMLTSQTTYISTVVKGMGKNVCARAKDTKYIDIKCYLDFLCGLLP